MSVYIIIIGIALLLFLIGAAALSSHQPEPSPAPQSSVSLSVAVSTASRKAEVWQSILEHHPEFSAPVFLDFATRLYGDVLPEIPGGQLPRSRPFLSSNIFEKLVLRGSLLEEVKDVVVTSATVSDCQVDAATELALDVALEATYAVRREGETKTFRAEETWTFVTGRPESDTSRGEISWVVTAIEVKTLEAVQPFSAESGSSVAIVKPRATTQLPPTPRWPAFVLVGFLGILALTLFITLKNAGLHFHEIVNIMVVVLGVLTLVVGGVIGKRLGLFLRVCPVCNKRALDVSSRIVVQPTEHCEGQGIKVEKCRNCLQQIEYPYRISRYTPS